MKKPYRVVEVVEYEVEAESREDAIEQIINDENRDSKCVAVTERNAYLKGE